jgi:protocatechuate 3,4-dioxygenase, beta subunit
MSNERGQSPRDKEALMLEDFKLTRRQLLAMSLAASGSVLAARLDPLFAETVKKPTPEQVMGPFYPVIKPPDQDADLTVIAGKPGKAKGQVINLMGRVFDVNGKPMPGVRLEIWQANTYGRYLHPSDTHDAPLDPNFQGSGVLVTDAEGRYWFKTVKPGSYPVYKGWQRPPHIHFEITGRTNQLVTQMYFEGEPLNEKDLIYKDTMDKELLLTKLMPPTKDLDPDSLVAPWDIVLGMPYGL